MADRPSTWVVLRSALTHLSPRLRRDAGVSLALSILTTICDLAGTIAVVPLVIALQGGSRPSCAICTLLPEQPPGGNGVVVAAVFFAAIMLVRQAMDLASTWTSRQVSQNIYHHLTHQLAKRYLDRPWLASVGQGRPVRVKHCVSTSLDAAYSYQVLVDMAACATEVLLLGCVLFIQMPKLTIGLGLGLGLAMLLVNLVLRARISRANREQDMMGRELHRQLTQTLDAAREIKTYKAHDVFLRMVDQTLVRLATSRKDLSTLPTIPRHVFELVVLIGLSLMVIVTAQSSQSSTSLLVDLAVIVVAARRLLPSMSRLLSSITELGGAIGSLHTINEELNAPLEPAPQFPPPRQPDMLLELGKIDFSYADGAAVLRQASFELRKGDRVAVVGASGAGKSSLMMIVAGLVRPAGGDVRLCPSTRLAYVPQETVLLDDNVKANILFGLPDSGDEPVWAVLDAVGLGPQVRQMPGGLTAAVGDHGFKLSGGQRQRIGLARALYRHPDLLLLDEATSALDEDTETMVLQAIDRFVGPGAVLFATHRQGALGLARAVYRIEHGQIVRTDNPVLSGS